MPAQILTHPFPESATEIRVLFPALLLDELTQQVPHQERDRFIADSVARELQRLRLAEAVSRLRDEPAWTDAHHPALMTVGDVNRYVQNLRERPSSYDLNAAIPNADE